MRQQHGAAAYPRGALPPKVSFGIRTAITDQPAIPTIKIVFQTQHLRAI